MSQAGQSREAFLPSSNPDKQEYQDIKKELQNRQMLEDGMSLADMRSLMQVVLESEKDPSNPREKTPEPPTSVNRISYAESLTSNINATERKSSSPELSTSQQGGKRLSLLEKQSSSQDDLIFGTPNVNTSRKPKDGQHSNANRGRAQSSNAEFANEGRNANKRRPNIRVQQDEKIAKSKINPLDFTENGKDARLEQHRRFLSDQSSNVVGSSGGVGSLDNSNKAIAQLCVHLRQIAEICHKQQGASVEPNFQWGAAIKIGETSERDGDEKNEPDDEASYFADDSNSERKSAFADDVVEDSTSDEKASASRSAVYDFGENSDEDDDQSDEDFRLNPKRLKTGTSLNSGKGRGRPSSKTVEKKKVEAVKAATSSEEAKSTFVHKKINKPAASLVTKISDKFTIRDDDEDNEMMIEPPKKIQRNKPTESETVYPRRIVPPNPSAKCTRTTARKTLFDRSVVRSTTTKKPIKRDEEKCTSGQNSSSLEDEEIVDLLDQNDERDPSTPIESDLIEIKPLRLSTRMKLQSQRLVKLQEKEKELESVRREQERMKEEVIRLQKIQRVQNRVQEEKEKQKRQEEAEKAKAKRESEWRDFVAQGERKRNTERTELYPDGRPKNNEPDVQTNNFIRDQSQNVSVTTIEDDTESNASRVRCPICNRGFTAEEIEAHAGACEEFDSCRPGISRSRSPSLTPPKNTTSKPGNRVQLFNCEICDNFSTDKGKVFENHTTECIKRKRYGEPFNPDTIIDVSTSPIRTVRTISEQTGSEINYKSQFVPKTRSNKVAGKKRKR